MKWHLVQYLMNGINILNIILSWTKEYSRLVKESPVFQQKTRINKEKKYWMCNSKQHTKDYFIWFYIRIWRKVYLIYQSNWKCSSLIILSYKIGLMKLSKSIHISILEILTTTPWHMITCGPISPSSKRSHTMTQRNFPEWEGCLQNMKTVGSLIGRYFSKDFWSSWMKLMQQLRKLKGKHHRVEILRPMPQLLQVTSSMLIRQNRWLKSNSDRHRRLLRADYQLFMIAELMRRLEFSLSNLITLRTCPWSTMWLTMRFSSQDLHLLPTKCLN